MYLGGFYLLRPYSRSRRTVVVDPSRVPTMKSERARRAVLQLLGLSS